LTVLLLNASYEPLSVIPYRRAVSLMLRERVDAATEEAAVLHGGRTVLHIPRVLRLRKYVNVPRRGARWSRRGVLARDGYRCIYCGVMVGDWLRGQLLTRTSFTLDHIVPRSRGGKNTWGNTACACYLCNNRKGDKYPHEAGLKLLWEPKMPRVDYLVASGEIPEAWKVYLELK
jgi:5-methylcytosine-specific restriction endonuclease McrA